MSQTRVLATNVDEVKKDLAVKVLEDLNRLRSAADDLERAVRQNESEPGMAIAYEWVNNLQRPSDNISVNISRMNGAVLVRATDEPNPSLVDRHNRP